MPRTFTVKNETTLQSLGTALLDARFGGAQAEAAMEQVKALNPHVDFQRIAPGTVLFVPETTGLKATAGTSAQSAPLDEFRALLSGALGDAAGRLKEGNAARAAGRADLAAALKSTAFKRVVGEDRDIAAQVTEAQEAMASEERDDKQAEENFAAVSKATLAALTQLRKLAG
ncbi:hypothetical protein [Reyranella sp.]|uniref:hypothetical protein n=1 Tax=Reyranella sp. TaxID=1929291 RepID=UPI003BAB3D5D